MRDMTKKLKVKTFSDMKQKMAKGPTKEIVLKADKSCSGTWFSFPQTKKLSCVISYGILLVH